MFLWHSSVSISRHLVGSLKKWKSKTKFWIWYALSTLSFINEYCTSIFYVRYPFQNHNVTMSSFKCCKRDSCLKSLKVHNCGLIEKGTNIRGWENLTWFLSSVLLNWFTDLKNIYFCMLIKIRLTGQQRQNSIAQCSSHTHTRVILSKKMTHMLDLLINESEIFYSNVITETVEHWTPVPTKKHCNTLQNFLPSLFRCRKNNYKSVSFQNPCIHTEL